MVSQSQNEQLSETREHLRRATCHAALLDSAIESIRKHATRDELARVENARNVLQDLQRQLSAARRLLAGIGPGTKAARLAIAGELPWALSDEGSGKGVGTLASQRERVLAALAAGHVFPVCNGTGEGENSPELNCNRCDGEGSV